MTALSHIIRTFVQIIGGVILAAGGTAFVFMVGVVFAGDGRMRQSLGQVWFQHDPFVDIVDTASLPLLGAIIERKVHPFLWNPVATTILGWPSWTALLVVALVLLALGGIIFWLATLYIKVRR